MFCWQQSKKNFAKGLRLHHIVGPFSLIMKSTMEASFQCDLRIANGVSYSCVPHQCWRCLLVKQAFSYVQIEERKFFGFHYFSNFNWVLSFECLYSQEMFMFLFFPYLVVSCCVENEEGLFVALYFLRNNLWHTHLSPIFELTSPSHHLSSLACM